MTKEAEKIAYEIKGLLDQIMGLVDQLAAMSTGQRIAKKHSKATIPASSKKGAAGGISMLIEEGFFDKPQDLSAVIGRLEQIGHYHSKSTVAMNLLNLVKRRIFNRIKDNKTKNWLYVIRR